MDYKEDLTSHAIKGKWWTSPGMNYEDDLAFHSIGGVKEDRELARTNGRSIMSQDELDMAERLRNRQQPDRRVRLPRKVKLLQEGRT